MLWLKSFHIITVVTWFAGLFYLPRLFVYHAELTQPTCKDYLRFCTMERRLYVGIMTPSALLTLGLGFWLNQSISHGIYWSAPWFHMKLTLVALLVLYHFWCGRYLLKFKKGANVRSPLYFRWFNEFPSLLLVAIVLLVVLKPF